MKSFYFYSVLSVALGVVLGGCQWTKDRPVLLLPDGNQDRMKKILFTGPSEDPKYWMSKVTVVDTSFGAGGLDFVFDGMQSEAKVGYFEFSRDKLSFYNAVTRKFMEKAEVASQGGAPLINKWDIKHSQYRLVEVDGYTTNREEENLYIPWNQKEWFTIDFSKADISETNTFPYYLSLAKNKDCWNKKSSQVVDASREVTEDYISFVVVVEYEQDPLCYRGLKRWRQDNFTYTVHYRYSFKKVPNPHFKDKEYTPYVMAGEEDPLLKKYGYFRTVREAIQPDGRDRNIFYMNRWNPHKKHIFYFTKEYPDEYRDLAHGVICHTNKLFAKHGLNNYPLNGKCREDGSVMPGEGETCTTGICFELRNNTGQKFGDIRYSFFQMLKAPVGGIFGYGPSDAHPATGEIVAGNVIASLHALDFYIKFLYEEPYKRDHKEYYDEEGNLVKTGETRYDTSSLFVKMKQTLKEPDPGLWTKTSKGVDQHSDIRSEFEYLLTHLTFGNPLFSGFTKGKKHSLNPLDFSVKNLGVKGHKSFVPDEVVQRMREVMHHSHEESRQNHHAHRHNHSTIYPLEPVVAQLPGLLASGLSRQEVKRRILFALLTHEFGHVLNLEHNFYGSVDIRNWPQASDGTYQMKTSSVMEYQIFKNRAFNAQRSRFGPYDEAALVYAYSGGKKDLSEEQDRPYLFCTNRHESLNALCNAWDEGSTPSEVMMSLIENYEELYFIRNLRQGRAYWNTSHYPGQILYDLWNMKKTLMMWRTAFRGTYISEELDLKADKVYTTDDKNHITTQISKDIRQAIKLSLAFYNSVLQLSSADRDWQSFYNKESGAIERVGIFWDKMFAMFFLMGDAGFTYNPNHSLGKASYLTYLSDYGFRQMVEEIMENTLTERVDMEPWFIDYGRLLYAQNASNHYNIALNGTLLEKIGVHCYTPRGLKEKLGIDPHSHIATEGHLPDFLDTAVVSMEEYGPGIKDPYFKGTSEQLGIVFFDGNYYVASSHINKYSFTIIDRMRRQTHSYGNSLRRGKQDVYDLFYLYHSFKRRGEIPTCTGAD